MICAGNIDVDGIELHEVEIARQELRLQQWAAAAMAAAGMAAALHVPQKCKGDWQRLSVNNATARARIALIAYMRLLDAKL